MRTSTALKKNLLIELRYTKSLYHEGGYLQMKINGVDIYTFGSGVEIIRDFEAVTEHQFVDGEDFSFVAKTFKVDKRNLFINGVMLCGCGDEILYNIHGALHEVTKYEITLESCRLVRMLDSSFVWEIRSLCSYINSIETTDLEGTIKELKAEYEPQVKHNNYFRFEIFEYRGKDFSRRYGSVLVGFVPENFDEEISKEVFKI